VFGAGAMAQDLAATGDKKIFGDFGIGQLERDGVRGEKSVFLYYIRRKPEVFTETFRASLCRECR